MVSGIWFANGLAPLRTQFSSCTGLRPICPFDIVRRERLLSSSSSKGHFAKILRTHPRWHTVVGKPGGIVPFVPRQKAHEDHENSHRGSPSSTDDQEPFTLLTAVETSPPIRLCSFSMRHRQACRPWFRTYHRISCRTKDSQPNAHLRIPTNREQSASHHIWHRSSSWRSPLLILVLRFSAEFLELLQSLLQGGDLH